MSRPKIKAKECRIGISAVRAILPEKSTEFIVGRRLRWRGRHACIAPCAPGRHPNWVLFADIVFGHASGGESFFRSTPNQDITPQLSFVISRLDFPLCENSSTKRRFRGH